MGAHEHQGKYGMFSPKCLANFLQASECEEVSGLDVVADFLYGGLVGFDAAVVAELLVVSEEALGIDVAIARCYGEDAAWLGVLTHSGQ